MRALVVVVVLGLHCNCLPIEDLPPTIPHYTLPCETPGNATLCDPPHPQIEAGQIPEAEVMPDIPPNVQPGLEREQFATVSVEFVDLGVSKQIQEYFGARAWDIVEQAGEEFGVKESNIQLVRNAGIDISPRLALEDLDDQLQLVVYLTCIPAQYRSLLITQIPTCESLEVRNLTALVEFPSNGTVVDVTVESTKHVNDVISAISLNLNKIQKITYNGIEVALNQSLESIAFRDRSAFVVYEKFPCPSHSPTPTSSPSPSQSPKVEVTVVVEPKPMPAPELSPIPKKRKSGASDIYRHCSTSRGGGNALPPPEALGLDAEAVDPNNRAGDPNVKCEESEMTEPEVHIEPSVKPIEPPPARKVATRGPMVEDAIIYAVFDKRTFPVHITPDAKGVDIFDAVTRATGIDHTYMVGDFLGVKFDHYAPLKPLGLIDGDTVEVSHPQMPDEPTSIPAPEYDLF